jgi:hypothetical protein
LPSLVVGRLANTPNTGDKGSSQVFSPHVVTPFEGIQTALSDKQILLEDSDSPEKARELQQEQMLSSASWAIMPQMKENMSFRV